MIRTFAALALAALFLMPTVAAADARTVTKDYTYVPGISTGCGAISPNEVCFPVLAGETSVNIQLNDAQGFAVPFVILAAAPGSGTASLGVFCGGTEDFFVPLPAGTRSVRVNFQVDAISVCGSVGTQGTATATFV